MMIRSPHPQGGRGGASLYPQDSSGLWIWSRGGGNEAIMDSLMIVLVSATIKYIMFKIGRIFVGILVIEH